MVSDSVRVIALCVVRRGRCILVFEGYDCTKGDYFYRPLGGGVEFGEQGAVAAAREMAEELDTEIRHVRRLGVLENLFFLNGQPGHEIVMVYEADFADESMYERSPIWGREDDNSPIKAVWKRMDDFEAGLGRLVPEGLLDMLERP